MVEENVTVESLSPNIAGTNAERDERVKSYVMDSVTRILNARYYLESKWLVMDRIWRGDPISRYYPIEQSTAIPEPFSSGFWRVSPTATKAPFALAAPRGSVASYEVWVLTTNSTPTGVPSDE